jgi:hypothetical protein
VLALLVNTAYIPPLKQFASIAVVFAILAVPASLITAIVGVIFDANKWPAILLFIAIPVLLALM